MPLSTRFPVLAALMLTTVAGTIGCGTSELGDAEPLDYTAPIEGGKGDGSGAKFDPNFTLSDAALAATKGIDGAFVQRFFEATPYGNRSWLADHRVDGRPASEIFAAIAAARQVNPIALLVLAQAASGLVSPTAAPSQERIDRALGITCTPLYLTSPIDRCVDSRYAGLIPQIEAAADMLAAARQASRDGERWTPWRKGVAHRSDDGVDVTPANDATAAIYSLYSPARVDRNVGGTWLIWRISARWEPLLRSGGQ